MPPKSQYPTNLSSFPSYKIFFLIEILSNTKLQSLSLGGISLMLLKTSLKKPGFAFTDEVQLAIEDGLGRVRIVLKNYT